MAQAAHDQIVSQSEPQHLTLADEQIALVVGRVYAHDAVTNTSYKISTIDVTEEGRMTLLINSATAFHKHAEDPEFHKRHMLKLRYFSDGRIEDPLLSRKRFTGIDSTAAFDARKPSAFLAMADSINRSYSVTRRAFESQNERSEREFITGQLGRIGWLRSVLGLKPSGTPMDFGDNLQVAIQEDRQ